MHAFRINNLHHWPLNVTLHETCLVWATCILKSNCSTGNVQILIYVVGTSNSSVQLNGYSYSGFCIMHWIEHVWWVEFRLGHNATNIARLEIEEDEPPLCIHSASCLCSAHFALNFMQWYTSCNEVSMDTPCDRPPNGSSKCGHASWILIFANCLCPAQMHETALQLGILSEFQNQILQSSSWAALGQRCSNPV